MKLFNIVMLLLVALFASVFAAEESVKDKLMSSLAEGDEVALRGSQEQEAQCGYRQVYGCNSDCGCIARVFGHCLGYKCCCRNCASPGQLNDSCSPFCPCVGAGLKCNIFSFQCKSALIA